MAETSERPRDASISNTEGVYTRLREMLLNGELAPGTPISQVKLSRAMGVSATPLREAMRLLQAEGLLIAEHNRRARVAPLDPRDIDATYAGRILMEALALRLTVPRLTPADITTLRGDLAAMAEAAKSEDLRGWEQAHRDFHRRLVQGADPALGRLIEPLVDRSERYRRFSVYGSLGQTWQIGNAEHEAILDACEAGDPLEAAELLGLHLGRSALTILAKAAPDGDPSAVRTAVQMVKRSG
jgi:DNA-binding GntR family transcriptional regulator